MSPSMKLQAHSLAVLLAIMRAPSKMLRRQAHKTLCLLKTHPCMSVVSPVSTAAPLKIVIIQPHHQMWLIILKFLHVHNMSVVLLATAQATSPTAQSRLPQCIFTEAVMLAVLSDIIQAAFHIVIMYLALFMVRQT